MPYTITCPYCFAEFSHKKVHFRMETQFSDPELNDEAMTRDEVNRLSDRDSRKSKLLEQTDEREPFLTQVDPIYKKYWETFGQTTEKSLGLDTRWEGGVYQLPVLDPGNIEHQKVLIQYPDARNMRGDYFIYDGDDFVSGIRDIHGHKTMRRVCPKCHNPLPRHYGKHPVKFISVIGVTGAGKTIYISQLLKTISNYATYINKSAYFTSDHEENFIHANRVEEGVPLPGSTQAGTFSQPMFYDFVSRQGDSVRTETIVIYDIAGEDCESAGRMEKFAEFINHSDGIILLIHPKQLSWIDGKEERGRPELVLNTIHNATLRTGKKLSEMPMAVCISQSDTFEDKVPEAINDIYGVYDEFTHENKPQFNATDYNVLQEKLQNILSQTPLANALKNGYKYYNYFAASAIGCDLKVEQPLNEDGSPVIGDDGKPVEITSPAYPPVPKRIAEPLFWLFYRFGFIGTDRPIRLPVPQRVPRYYGHKEKSKKFLFLTEEKEVRRELTYDEKNEYWYDQEPTMKLFDGKYEEYPIYED